MTQSILVIKPRSVAQHGTSCLILIAVFLFYLCFLTKKCLQHGTRKFDPPGLFSLEHFRGGSAVITQPEPKIIHPDVRWV